MKEQPVLLISGWAHGSEAMQPIADSLSERNRATLLSLPDLGISRGNGGEISDFALSVASYLDKPAIIVGWSTGGIVGIEAAINYPEQVAGLVLLSSTARFCSDAEYETGVQTAVLRAMVRGMRRKPESVVADFLSQAAFPTSIPADELDIKVQNALAHGVQPLIDGLEYLAKMDLRESLPAVTAPCLVLHGKQDRIVPWQAALHLASKLPHSKTELLSSAGHSLVEQGGKDLMVKIAAFVDSIR